MATSNINPTYGAVLFCTECGSNRLDVNGWADDGGEAIIVCYACRAEHRIKGLTIGRADLRPAQLLKAVQDRAQYDPVRAAMMLNPEAFVESGL